jgi:hypothetical protein
MFTPHYFIDNIQQVKRNVVTALVKDGNLRNEMLGLIDAQAQFYHSSVDSSLTIMVTLLKNFAPNEQGK